MSRSDELALDKIIADNQEANELQQRRYLTELRKHPECSDPDHPGCDECDEEEA